jgi:hypothetical protein
MPTMSGSCFWPSKNSRVYSNKPRSVWVSLRVASWTVQKLASDVLGSKLKSLTAVSEHAPLSKRSSPFLVRINIES